MSTKPRSRKLHIHWVTAGERRLVAHALHQAGFTNRHIAELLQVSPNTISKDLNR
jgi:IS30 family transposase